MDRRRMGMEKTNVIPASGRAFKGAAFSTLSASKPRLHTASPNRTGHQHRELLETDFVTDCKKCDFTVQGYQKPDPMSIMALLEMLAHLKTWGCGRRRSSESLISNLQLPPQQGFSSISCWKIVSLTNQQPPRFLTILIITHFFRYKFFVSKCSNV